VPWPSKKRRYKYKSIKLRSYTYNVLKKVQLELGAKSLDKTVRTLISLYELSKDQDESMRLEMAWRVYRDQIVDAVLNRDDVVLERIAKEYRVTPDKLRELVKRKLELLKGRLRI